MSVAGRIRRIHTRYDATVMLAIVVDWTGDERWYASASTHRGIVIARCLGPTPRKALRGLEQKLHATEPPAGGGAGGSELKSRRQEVRRSTG